MTRKITKTRDAWFEIAKTEHGWEWCLWSGNGRVLACSASAYGNVNDCKQGIRNFMEAMKMPDKIAIRMETGFLKSDQLPEPSKSSSNQPSVEDQAS